MADVTLDDGTKGALDGMGDAMNEGAGTALYAIGSPVLIAALTALSLVLVVQGVTAIAGATGRLFTRDGAAWLGSALLATMAAAVVARNWDDPSIDPTLYAFQQKARTIALIGGYIIGGWIVWAFTRARGRY